ncbi:hypothetical protein ABMA27_002751 [Loxostege sticticalis]|uniref:Uncharacterized protein n=1 Tax=Loxostege sticticalis TaxID=481309 RepID=A0ABR3HUS0_LOXSC
MNGNNCLLSFLNLPFITRCKSDDDNCLKKSTSEALPVLASGLPEYGVNSLDPVIFTRIDASTPVLSFLIDDVIVKGFKKCIPLTTHRDSKKSKISIKVLCDGGKMDGRYMITGQVLFVPIEGNGKMHVDLRKEIAIDFRNTYFSFLSAVRFPLKNWTYTYDLKGKSNVYFENLFNKESFLGQTAQEMVASNGNAIIHDIGKPIITAIVTEIVHNVQRFFKAVPSEDLSLD